MAALANVGIVLVEGGLIYHLIKSIHTLISDYPHAPTGLLNIQSGALPVTPADPCDTIQSWVCPFQQGGTSPPQDRYAGSNMRVWRPRTLIRKPTDGPTTYTIVGWHTYVLTASFQKTCEVNYITADAGGLVSFSG